MTLIAQADRLKAELDAARMRAAGLADALELKLIDFINHGNGEMTLTVSEDDWRSMSAALKTAPEEDPRVCWPMTEDQYWRDRKLREQIQSLRDENARLREALSEAVFYVPQDTAYQRHLHVRIEKLFHGSDVGEKTENPPPTSQAPRTAPIGPSDKGEA